MAFRVADAEHAYRRVLEHGAEPADQASGSLVMNVPAVKGIGNSLLYFLDTYGDRSQIEEYLHQYKGESIQHMACGCRDVYETVEALRARGLQFMPAPPATYYERIGERVPGHGEDVERLKRNGILLDGEGAVALGAKNGTMAKVLLQIFSANAIGPIFFEFIQRKGDEGFGEGNFRACSYPSRRTKSVAACCRPRQSSDGRSRRPSTRRRSA